MIAKMWIEGDGATDRYGIGIQTKDSYFRVCNFTREEMNYYLKDLVDQFLSVTSCFDDMKKRESK